jgi:quercetin dioxygenase-like cupin family protein
MPFLEFYESLHDERGEITDLLRNVEIDSVTLIRTRKGAVRGNHYHHETEQYTYILEGAVWWVAQTPGVGRSEKMARKGDLILSPANERHAMRAEEDSVFLVFTRGPRSGNNYESDTFRIDPPLIAPE